MEDNVPPRRGQIQVRARRDLQGDAGYKPDRRQRNGYDE